MPVSPLHFPSRTFSPCLCTLMVVSVNVAVQPSSHSFPMEISAPDWRWGEMCDIFALIYSKGIGLSSALWVACMMLPSGRITSCPCEVLILLLHNVSTLIYFCVGPVSTITYGGLLFGGFPPQLLQSLLVCLIYSTTLVKSLLINL